MKALSVIELAKLYGMNRQSVYKRINKGDLSKNSNGKIDLSEAIRVFGEPSQRSIQNVTLQSQATVKSAEVDMLKQHVDMLQNQLHLAQEREAFQREQLQAKDNQIYSLQLLLGTPRTEEKLEKVDNIAPDLEQQIPKTEDKPKIQQQESVQKKRSLFGHVISTIFN